MTNLLSFGLNILADVFYPKYCFGCRRSGSYLCRFCITNITSLAQNFCVVCNNVSAGGFTHSQCKVGQMPDRLLSAFPYQNSIVSDMIITGKYYFIPEVFAILGALTAENLFSKETSLIEEVSIQLSDFSVCAIPLHTTRLRWRGFNQSEIAARIFAQGLQLPYLPLLTRTKNTRAQKDLNIEARRSNILNAFYCPSTPPQKIILIDDVTTTGQTFLEATRALKLAGAQTVWCISIAKD